VVDGTPHTPEKVLVVDLSEPPRLVMKWTQGQTVISLSDPVQSSADLALGAEAEWKVNGGHQDPSDQKFDQAVIVVGANTLSADAMAVCQALATPKRERKSSSGSVLGPVFQITVLRGDDPALQRPTPPPVPSGAPIEGPPALMEFGAISVSGRLPPDVIMSTMTAIGDRIRSCYEDGLRRNGALQGIVMVRFVVGRDGRVSNVGGGGDLPDQVVTKCIAGQYYALDFPQPEGGIVTISAPIKLARSDNCQPCASQEDFDGAGRKGRKCCPVRACEGDRDCVGGRVCCRIPMGTLCSDAARCPAKERVP